MNLSKESTYSKFIQALNIMNAALEAHRDSPIFKPMISACDALMACENLGVKIYDDAPENPKDFFTIRLMDGTFVLVDHGKQPDDIAWAVSESYLEKVASDPARYLKNPALLSFDWLRERLGLLAHHSGSDD